ncbi:MAG TPA: alpha/beta fold hydrolase [Nocardioidaceae bacterium]|nr:alpha/beta fold hydrolase [Nocardioidaceae bacterium]
MTHSRETSLVFRWRPLLAAVILVGALGGCGSANGSSATPSVPSPRGDFYTPPDPLQPAAAGTLIWAEQVAGLEDIQPPATVWRILYHSRSRDNVDIAVSGLAVVPTAAPPDGGRPVYAWAHGTVGLGDQCAPSREPRENLPPYGGMQVERGAVLVATDYEGLGTPGIPTSTVAAAHSHAVLDSIRAAAALPNVGGLGDVVVAGHSQGGAAALTAAEMSLTYAPELELVGVVALAPGVELPALVDHLATTSTGAAMALIGAVGLRAGYPDLDLATMFTPSATADVARLETECLDDTIARYQALSTSDVVANEPSTLPKLQALLAENSPGAVTPGVPVFLGHGEDDQKVPVELSDVLGGKYCALGVSVVRHVYAGDHDAVIDEALDDAMAFIQARFDHEPVVSTC